MSPLRNLRRLGSKGAGSLSVLGLALLEILAIVAAVVLGFMVNDWRESRARARTAESALTSLAQEMAHNHQRIEQTFAYYSWIHRQVLEVLDEQTALPVAERPRVYGYQLEGWRGAMPPMLRSSTWQMMVSTGTISDLPFEQADALAQVYNFQAVLERMDEALIDKFVHDPGFADIRTIGHVFGVYAELFPAVIGLYQAQGRPILAAFGYDIEIDDPSLREEARKQVAGIDLEIALAEPAPPETEPEAPPDQEEP
jgi:hypothetical protein